MSFFATGPGSCFGSRSLTALVLVSVAVGVAGCGESTEPRAHRPGDRTGAGNRRQRVQSEVDGESSQSGGFLNLTARMIPSGADPAGKEPLRVSGYQRRKDFDTSGFSLVGTGISRWDAAASLQDIADIWRTPGRRATAEIELQLPRLGGVGQLVRPAMAMAMFLHYEGDTVSAGRVLERLRGAVERDPAVASEWLYSIIYFQGVTALRQGESDNCIACRGESSCILPLNEAARHTNARGSRSAVAYFLEYLAEFPDDRPVQWLLNVASMTLGEHPNGVPERFRVSLAGWGQASPVGAFKEVSADVGVDRLNQSGGCISEDFDGDGLLDVLVTSINPTVSAASWRNRGDGRFREVSEMSGLNSQTGGLNCVQADFDNDGFIDVLVVRGAWFLSPIRPSLLRNEGDGTWRDVTLEAGLGDALNSNSACWADYDNDGDMDVFVCCERQANRLYQNLGDGRFDRVGPEVLDCGVELRFCKGAVWLDINNDGWQDLFINNLQGRPQLFVNQRGERFSEQSEQAGIDGPHNGFACWSWDYDNDGWLDIFASSYERDVGLVLDGMQKPPEAACSGRLWRNTGGRGFVDVSAAAGVAGVYETMGCNFGDIDNDGRQDFYLGTGDPDIATLIPNRLFHNRGVAGFAEITAASRTGSLQKGHGVSFGDWNRDGNLDLFVQMGGAVPGDQYHNLLFQNSGCGNRALRLRLVGVSAARGAAGARVRVIPAGESAQQIHLVAGSGSSFGANPLELHAGLGVADAVSELEVIWPGSGRVQRFRDFSATQMLTLVEGRDPVTVHVEPVKSVGLPAGTKVPPE